MTYVFDTHKFLFTLNYEGKLKGSSIHFENRSGQKTQITIDRIDVSPSPLSCIIFDTLNKKHIIPYVRISHVYDEKGELIWGERSKHFQCDNY